jgi:transposase
LLAILPDQRQATLRACLRSLPEEVRQRVIGVCIDLKAGYRSVLRAELPGARVVADRFHVIADANRRLDETRRLEGGALREALPRWPLLKGGERLSERQAARLAEMVARFPAIAEQHWCKERPGYFEVSIANGFTEGCHTKIMLLKRLSYGYRNVEVYRRRMLLGFLPVFPQRSHHTRRHGAGVDHRS